MNKFLDINEWQVSCATFIGDITKFWIEISLDESKTSFPDKIAYLLNTGEVFLPESVNPNLFDIETIKGNKNISFDRFYYESEKIARTFLKQQIMEWSERIFKKKDFEDILK